MNINMFANIVASTSLLALVALPLGCDSIKHKGGGRLAAPGFGEVWWDYQGESTDELPDGMSLCYQATDAGSGFNYCVYRADCDDPMSETWVDLNCDARNFERVTPRLLETTINGGNDVTFRNATMKYDGQNDTMNLSFTTSVNLAPLAVQAPGLRLSVSVNPISDAPTPIFLNDWAPGSGSGALSYEVSLKGNTQAVVNHIASFGIDLVEFEARNGRTYAIEREGLLPIYNIYLGDIVVDSIWVD